MLDAEGLTKRSSFGRVMAGVAICGLFIFAVAIAVFTRSGVSAAKLQAKVAPERHLPEILPGPDKRPPAAESGFSNAKPKPRAAGASAPAVKAPIKTDQDEWSGLLMPVQFNNDPQIPILITEAQVEVGEPFDITAIFNPFSSPPRMMRDLKFTLKLVNQGDQPVTGLKLAVQSPLFSHTGLGIEGKKTSLGARESATVTWGCSVDDQEYALDLASNIQLKPIAVTHDAVESLDFPRPRPYLLQRAGLLPAWLKRGTLLVDVVFHDIKELTGVKN